MDSGQCMRGMVPEAEPITLPVDRGLFDPPPGLGRIREQTPLRRLRFADGHVGWLVTSYELAREILGDRRFSLHPFRAVVRDPQREIATTVDDMRRDVRLAAVVDRYENGGRPAYEALADPEVVDIQRSDPPHHMSSLTILDPPRHTEMRRLVAAYFAPRRVSEHQQLVERIVTQQLDAMEQAMPPLDLVEAFCLPIPSQVICALFGASPAERDRFEEPARVLLDSAATAEQQVAANRALDDFTRELVARKRTDPADDLLTELIQGGQLSDDEIARLALTLFRAGHETTASMLALSVLTLLQDRTRWDALRADPAMVGAAVEELLRFHTLFHVSAFTRTAVQDLELAGQTIRAGETVAVSLAAANRDPDRFADPDRLDLTRQGVVGHLTFSHGIHQCLGQHLARLELRIGLTALTSRLPDLRLAVPIEDVPMYAADQQIYGVRHLPVTW